MTRYPSRRSQQSRYNPRTKGHEQALEHIRQYKQLSAELGGTFEDVKQYFFSLNGVQLREILDEYQAKYGKVKRDYAELTIPKWRSGQTHMSGLVAERLFSLLPPRMPSESKFRLVENLWKHYGPSSKKTYYVGVNANEEDVVQVVTKHLDEIVTGYQVPKSMEARFKWLSQGDVAIKQELLNHFLDQEKSLLSEGLRQQLPVLLSHLRSEEGKATNFAFQTLIIGKHEIKIELNRNVTGVTCDAPSRRSTQAGGLFSKVREMLGF